MLVLRREVGEEIVISDQELNVLAVVMVTSVAGNQVKLGTSAPSNLLVHRREVFDKVKREKSQKASGQA